VKTVGSLSFAVSVAAIGLSHAADLAVPAPEPAAPLPMERGWDGFYAGLGAGTALAPMEIGGTDLLIGDFASRAGSTGYLLFGRNWSSGPIVYGLEAEIAVHELKGDGGGFTADYLWHGALRARAGYDFGRVLPFVAAGVSYLPVNIHRNNAALSDVANFTGLTAGAGVDIAWTPSIVTRFDYAYTHYGSQNFVLGGVPGSASLQSHAFRGALIFREGDGAVSGAPLQAGRSGIYGGALAGFGFGKGENTNPLFTSDYSLSGGSIGLFGGIDYAFGDWFAGIDINGRALTHEGDGPGLPGSNVGAKLHWAADARARFGRSFGDFSPYFAAGFSLAQVETRTQNIANPAIRSVDLGMHYGATAAIGADYALSDRLFLRGEYAFTYYTPASSTLGLGGVGEHRLDNHHEFRVGLGYRLGD
jgi:outer membrane immunogenic protein